MTPPAISDFRAFYENHVRGLTAGDQASGHCPLHHDEEKSFSVHLPTGLWTCHSGCGDGNALKFAERMNIPFHAVPGCTARDIRRTESPSSGQVYSYCDESGAVLYQEVRRLHRGRKKIVFQRPDGAGGYINNLHGVRRVPYRLPELIKATAAGTSVFIVEGPNKVEALRSLGLVATCNPLGAGKWADEYSIFLKGLDVVILPDNDGPGRKHAQKVALSVYGTSKSIRLLELPGLSHKGDIIDWLRNGGTADKLMTLVKTTQVGRLTTDPVKPISTAPRTEGYFQAPNWPYTCGIWREMTQSEKAVYPVLARRADNVTRNCMTTLKEIARESGVFWKSVSAVTDKLVRRGLIKKSRRGNRAHYHILMAPPASLQTTATQPSDAKAQRRGTSFHEGTTGRFVAFAFD